MANVLRPSSPLKIGIGFLDFNKIFQLRTIRFSSHSRFVALHVVAINEETISTQDITGFQHHDVSHIYVKDRNLALFSCAHDFDLFVVLAFVEFSKLFFFLIVLEK